MVGTWFRVASWTIGNYKGEGKTFTITFENSRSITPDVALSASQLAAFAKDALQRLDPSVASNVISEILNERIAK